MNSVVCNDCGAVISTRGQKFVPGERCQCGGLLGINIKGTKTLYTELSNGSVKIPRRFRPVLKDGSPCNKSAIRGALPSSVPGH